MNFPRLPNASPATRVAAGLVALMISLLLLGDLFVPGFLADRLGDAKRERLFVADLIAPQVAQALRTGDDAPLQSMLDAMLRHDPQLLSVAVLAGTSIRAVAGDHARQWRVAADAPSTIDKLRAPILTDGKAWGELQLAFSPALPDTPRAWLLNPTVLGAGLMALLGFVVFQLYLRRAMRYLDPGAAVPERVRTAFDTLVEGVLVLDTDGRIMLTNKAFLGLGKEPSGSLIGSEVNSLAWLGSALQQAGRGRPWELALKTRTPQLAIPLRINDHPAGRREVIMNSTPIQDGFSRPRGCLVTFSDVTELQERTERLHVAMGELQASREEIRLKNDELTLLATRDALTGCLNRRAFLQETEQCIAAALREEAPLCCIMCDVDHFKSINDRFGHGGGDEVLKAVAKALGRGLRTGDLLGRYGGEEFCVVLPNANLAQALEIAERLRGEVEANAGNAVRQFADVRVTMSFGVEQLSPQASDFAALIDLADQALYHSKKHGRNRVTARRDMPVSMPKADETAPAI